MTTTTTTTASTAGSTTPAEAPVATTPTHSMTPSTAATPTATNTELKLGQRNILQQIVAATKNHHRTAECKLKPPTKTGALHTTRRDQQQQQSTTRVLVPKKSLIVQRRQEEKEAAIRQLEQQPSNVSNNDDKENQNYNQDCEVISACSSFHADESDQGSYYSCFLLSSSSDVLAALSEDFYLHHDDTGLDDKTANSDDVPSSHRNRNHGAEDSWLLLSSSDVKETIAEIFGGMYPGTTMKSMALTEGFSRAVVGLPRSRWGSILENHSHEETSGPEEFLSWILTDLRKQSSMMDPCCSPWKNPNEIDESDFNEDDRTTRVYNHKKGESKTDEKHDKGERVVLICSNGTGDKIVIEDLDAYSLLTDSTSGTATTAASSSLSSNLLPSSLHSQSACEVSVNSQATFAMEESSR